MNPNAAYAYRAARQDGVQEYGIVEAESRNAAADLLARRGLFPIELRLDAAPEEGRVRVSSGDLALGLRMLATLLESGLPISHALLALDELAPRQLRDRLPSIREAVREGNGLARALAASRLDVPSVVLGIIEAGEAGSGIAPAVRRAAELMESAAAIRAAVRAALAYPVLLACAGAASIALLAGIVLPRFASILADLGQSLPTTTRLVLAAATAARVGTVPAVLALGIMGLAWRGWTTSEAGRLRWHEMLLTLPVVGPARRSAATARAAAALASLLESGVPVARALLHAAKASGDGALAARMLAAREAIVTGEGLARAIEAEAALTPVAIRLVRTGERTGRLPEMLDHAAQLERERATQIVQSAVRIIEPALILVFAGLVAFVAAALLQAVYGVRPVP